MFPLARTEKLTVREMPDETLVYDLEHHKAHCLNRVSALIWKHCDGQTNLPSLAALLRRQLGTPNAAAVVNLALEQLARRGLLAEAIRPVVGVARLSRRDILKKLAVASVAMPVVMTIAAPSARAAETVPVRTGCLQDSDCIDSCSSLDQGCFEAKCFIISTGGFCHCQPANEGGPCASGVCRLGKCVPAGPPPCSRINNPCNAQDPCGNEPGCVCIDNICRQRP